MMDAKERKSGELSMTEKVNNNGGEVAIPISNSETPRAGTGNNGYASPLSTGCPSPEIRCSANPIKPPKIPTYNNDNTLNRRKSFVRSSSIYNRPKSRFGEQASVDAIAPNLNEETLSSLQEQMGVSSPYKGVVSRTNSRIKSFRTNSMTSNKSQANEPGGGKEEEEDYEQIYKLVKQKMGNEKHRRVTTKFLVELFLILCILGCLVASLTVDTLVNKKFCGVEIWKWCVLVFVTLFGMLFTQWVMHFVVFLIEKNFMLRKKVLYFVYGLKTSVRVFVWLGCILLAWVLLVKEGLKRSHHGTKALNYITWTLMSLLIGSFLWLLKTLLLKILASNFHVNRVFDRIQESVLHQYILQTLSGPPLIDEALRVGKEPSGGRLSFSTIKKDKKEKKVIDMSRVHRMKQEKVSAWTMKVLVDAVMNSGLSTISNTLDETVYGEGAEGDQADREINNEMQAICAAYDIFKNVAQTNPRYIEEDDLLRFMLREEVDIVFPLFEAYEVNPAKSENEPRRIGLKALADWVVKVYQERKALAHALNDTKTAVKQLNKLVTGILIVIVFIIWLLLMEIATTKILVLLSSQLLLAGFIFSNTCKTIFEAIIFVFVMHPFDVGDRCVIDGVAMMVEEMNILSTVFLKLDQTKVYYPNSVLATKAICNYYRSPNMGDTVEFSIDFTTSAEKIGMLKEHIKEYLLSNPLHWHPNHNVIVKEIENVNMIKMCLYPNHTMNFQDYAERNRRRSTLVLELKKIFEKLGIKYDLPPQKVHLSHMGSESTGLEIK